VWAGATLAAMPPPGRDFVSVVSGLPRSGTSLVMQMLGAGGLPLLCDDARPADAHNPRGYLEYAPVKRLREDAAFLGHAVGRAVKVVVPLACALPAGAYRVVLVRRDLREVIASQDAMLGGAVAGLSAQRLAVIYAAQLQELEAWARGRPQVRLLCLEHAELLREPPRAASSLAAFLGGGLDVEAMAAAVDPSLHRQRA
jgi:hypothetical protein